MSQLVLFAIDICAVALLVFGLYFPRHRRRDLVVAYLGVNVGVLAVASALSASDVGAGLGLGLALFGVLSIIRLRSTELDQHEVAYYFSALALGILGALSTTSVWLSGGLMALIVAVMFVGDHRRLLRHYRHQIMVLDSAVTDHVALVAQLEQLLNARVHNAIVQRLDMVNETTVVDVRYSVARRSAAAGTSKSVRAGALR
ncbi:DUF4956 domain-containing protein [Micromonospora sp. PSH03]|uniref:DUF4956 domain-containing protein n=2 Tax=Micromonospora TaxID=1873 RepID=A0A1C4TYV2_9ACTN|nr:MULTISPECIES: DUF4956 domain-containing protein [Micromonospora]MBM0204966.1 DUF4956 domain-containing protein [Micromonospora sp. STR1s_5]WTI09407.1 DUF4956 domain-containing protein [Micromonospora sp. NBC_00821]MBQ0989133.1 DUF4956 domain-containing protein [Micromonospora sp. H61]MCG5443122.1 DUF4956 domain-containing protein [Micromonospora trifolii]MCG5450248.1 DUF4956 domain-containing protein [Micromonospora hortensis]